METFDLNKITREIRTKTSIPEKLDYWKEILIKYFFEPIERKQIESQNNHETSMFRDDLIIQLFSDPCWAPYFPIPKAIYDEHFESAMSNPELTYWFLKYYADRFFKSRIEVLKSGGGLNSTITITKELLRINELEEDAKEWFLQTKGINLNTTPAGRPEREKIEIIRVLDREYYKNYPVSVIHARGGNITVEVYAEHVYLKEFLETKFKELEATDKKSQTTPKTVTDYTRQDEKNITGQNPEPEVPDEIPFTKNNYEIEIRDWNKKHNNNLTKWIQNGQIVKVEKWLFVNKDVLLEQKQTLNDLYALINMPLIDFADLHDEVIDICIHYADSVETLLDHFFADSKDMQITMPFSSLCPKIIKQPKYIIVAYLKHPYDLPEHKRTYYRYKYLKNKLGFGKDKFHEYKKDLNRSIEIEISNSGKNLVHSMFQFIEQFIYDLRSLQRTKFNYISSPLFRLLFEEVIKFKGYYLAAFGQFTFTNILEIEDALKTLKTNTLELYPSLDKEQSIITLEKNEAQNTDSPKQSKEDEVILFTKNIDIIKDQTDRIKDKFITEKEYKQYIEVLANYFCGLPYDKELSIKLKRGSKTKVATIFNNLHKELSSVEILKRDTEYMNVIRILDPYEGLSDSEIYKVITR